MGSPFKAIPSVHPCWNSSGPAPSHNRKSSTRILFTYSILGEVFSLGGRSFSSDVKCLLSTGFQPLKKAFSFLLHFFRKLLGLQASQDSRCAKQ